MKTVCGIGINDADYPVCPRVNGKQVWCPFYRKWKSILERCGENYLKGHPTYGNCKICREWIYFSKFKAWMEKQDWKGKEPDKDLLGDGKLYSPETVVFVSHRVNSFMSDSRASRGEFPIGVCKARGKFLGMVRIGSGTRKHLGYFDTPEEAHQAWKAEKIKIGERLIEEQTDTRVKEGLRKYLDKL